MSRTYSYLVRTFAGSLILLAACAEGTSPDRRATASAFDASAALLDDPHGVLVGSTPVGFLVAPALRLTPLATDVTWSFVAGPAGATSTNAATGLTVVVPVGALSTTQTISVTALAGPTVAYRFEPHGLQFDQQVLLFQAMAGLASGDKHLRGAYFPDAAPAIDPLTGLTIVTELEPTKFDKNAGLVRIKIRHFSGYILASGRDGASDGETSGGY